VEASQVGPLTWWKLRRKEDLLPKAASADRPSPSSRQPHRAKSDAGPPAEERRPFRNVEVRKLGPGHRDRRGPEGTVPCQGRRSREPQAGRKATCRRRCSGGRLDADGGTREAAPGRSVGGVANLPLGGPGQTGRPAPIAAVQHGGRSGQPCRWRGAVTRLAGPGPDARGRFPDV
jgi:hypothetical protein